MQNKQWLLCAVAASMLAAAGCADDPVTAASCNEDEVWTGSECIPESNDNCGMVGVACKNGNVCRDHLCQCVDPATNVGIECSAKGWVCGNGVCANTDNDVNNCGTVGHKCDEGWTCYLGTCTDNCSGGMEMCKLPSGGSMCIDTNSNKAHCGECNKACPAADASKHVANSFCSDSTCEIVCEQGWEDKDDDAANGCESKVDTSKSVCGNGVVEAGEACDGTKLNDQTCASVVGAGSTGSLFCKPGCLEFDTTLCSKPTTCGNGSIDGQEVCDGKNVDGKTCAQVVGEGSNGALSCAKNCREFDTSLCSVPTTCGNGKVDSGEICDGNKLQGMTCETYLGTGSTGTIKCKTDCSGYDISDCTAAARCGNGVLEAGEACDGVQFANGATCETLVGEGSKGALQCDSSCNVVTTSCSAASTCHNGKLDKDEVCDGKLLNNQTCESVVGAGSVGTLSCLSNCSGFDKSGCTAPSTCGNGFIENGEVCDGTKLNDQTCATVVGAGSKGTLKCNSTCTGYVTDACTQSTTCGNGIIENGEVCDGVAINGATCDSQVGSGSIGNVFCGADCKHYDLSGCSARTTCGNGKIDSGEVCESGDLRGKTCADIVGPGSTGTLKCGSNCYAYDTSGCSAAKTCGNGKIDDGEICDGENVAGAVCSTVVGNGSIGVVRCAKNCMELDLTHCSPEVTCGNGKLDAGEVCDGAFLNGATCDARVGFGSTGTVRCNSTCSGYDLSGCSEASKCGNGALDKGEICDGSLVNGKTCQDLVGHGSYGVVLCDDTCSGYNTDNCSPEIKCGNGKLDAGEVCDGTILGGATCESVLGTGSEGLLKCNSTCTGYDQSACSKPKFCGDGKVDEGEECDGTKFNGSFTSCSGYNSDLYTSGGKLKCASNCTIDVSECISWCGNGSVNVSKGEACDHGKDGDKFYPLSTSCATVVGPGSTGTLTCADDCSTIKTNLCTAATICGDGIVNSASEECDGTAFRNGLKDCSKYSDQYKAGKDVVCLANCTVDTSACELKERCGDGIVNVDGEQCDGTAFLNGVKSCASLDGSKYSSGTVKCNNSTCTYDFSACVEKPVTPVTTCGNGVLDSGEACDGTLFGGATCTSYSSDFSGGTLKCTSKCEIDASACTLKPVDEPKCGNGVVDVDAGELCDGTKFKDNRYACKTIAPDKYSSGHVTCNSTCGYDFSACVALCGDGIVSGTKGEACDHGSAGDKFPSGKSCESIVGAGSVGTLACSSDCKNIITDGCSAPAKCGDGVVNQSSEYCDGSKFRDDKAACTYWNSAYTGGNMKCTSDCKLDESACTAPAAAVCGDGIVNQTSEECDGSAFDSSVNTCEKVDSKYSGGTLKCKADCTIDDSACTLKQVVTCGNGQLDEDEDCDGTKFAAGMNTCAAVIAGSTGTVSCTKECTIDTSNCKEPICGDGIVNQDSEVCDGTAIKSGATFDCATYSSYYASGKMTCKNCQLDTSSCVAKCGNGVVDSGEECDGTAFASGKNTCGAWLNDTTGTLNCTKACKVDTTACVAKPTATCGDGIVNTDAEKCDGTAFFNGIKDCSKYNSNYASGVLSCNSDCTLNESKCVKKASSTCGDGVFDPTFEECDAGKFRGNITTCSGYSTSYNAGMLKCTSACKIDTSACSTASENKCGNGKLDDNEWCDGKLFYDGKTACSDWGDYASGTVSCSATCEVSYANCVTHVEAKCGDGVVNQPNEECDGNAFMFDETTCHGWDSSFTSGNVKCNSDCTIDYSMCKDEGSGCGNGIVDGDEYCDGTAFYGSDKCSDYGFASGKLACNSNCSISYKNCVLPSTNKCGDNAINASNEECDGSMIYYKNCSDWDGRYASGTVSCSKCKIDYSQCKLPVAETATCGDGKLATTEACDGTQFMYDIKTCAAYDPSSYVSGNLKCNKCQIDTSDCKKPSTCTEGEYRCVGNSYQLCNVGSWIEINSCDVGYVCDTGYVGNGCKKIDKPLDVTWCVFNWLNESTHDAYARVRLPSGVSADDMYAELRCTTDLSKPVLSWEAVEAYHNAACSDCYENTEYMVDAYDPKTNKGYKGKPGTNYCAFVFLNHDNVNMFACKPAAATDNQSPVAINNKSVFDAGMTRSFTNASAACNEGDTRCTSGNVEMCDEGSWVLYDTCEGATPVCDAKAGECIAESASGSYDVTETFSDAKASTGYTSNYTKNYSIAGTLTLKNAAFYSSDHIIDGMTAIYNGKSSTTLTIEGLTAGVGTVSLESVNWSSDGVKSGEAGVDIVVTVGSKTETISYPRQTMVPQKVYTFTFNNVGATKITITTNQHNTTTSNSRILVDNVRWTSAL